MLKLKLKLNTKYDSTRVKKNPSFGLGKSIVAFIVMCGVWGLLLLLLLLRGFFAIRVVLPTRGFTT